MVENDCDEDTDGLETPMANDNLLHVRLPATNQTETASDVHECSDRSGEKQLESQDSIVRVQKVCN